MPRPKNNKKPKQGVGAGHRSRAGQMKNRALNAFDTAVDDEFYIKGLRQQQDIDLEDIADEKIRELINGEVKSDEDEEIDSDEAFGSDSDIALNGVGEEESDWGESLDETQLVSLSEAWDMDDAEEFSDNELTKGTTVDSPHDTVEQLNRSPNPRSRFSSDLIAGASLSGDETAASESEFSDSEDGGSSVHSASSGATDGTAGELFSEVDDDSDSDVDGSALREAINKVAAGLDRTGHLFEKHAGPENPFMLPSASEKLSLKDFSGAVPTSLGLLKPKIASKTLAIPLPKRMQERVDRAAAYEIAKKEVSQWDDVVRENRRAEHLVFPLPLQTDDREKVSPFLPTEKAERTNLEATVQEILTQSALLDETAVSAFEDASASKLTYDEFKERQQQLRYMRELMFREEQRAKRVKKIKSKSYRRVHKKDRERQAALVREAEGDQEMDGEAQLRQRALERASLKHKSTSKWARRMITQGMSKDAGTRAEMEEMLRQGESLRRNILGSDGSDDDSSDYDDDNADNRKTGDGGNQSDLSSSVEDPAVSRKGILGMKFMLDAAEKERKATERLLAGDDSGQEDVNPGRKTFDPTIDESSRLLDQAQYNAQQEDNIENSRSLDKRLVKRQKTETKSQGGDIELRYIRKAPESAITAESNSGIDNAAPAANPWLALSSDKGQSSFSSMNRNSSEKSKSEHKLKKAKASKTGGSVTIDMDASLGDGIIRSDQLTLQQQDMVRRAFAGDDVVAEFREEKRAVVEEDDDKEVDETLPGWGSWGGDGLESRVRRIRKVAGIRDKNRRDYKKDNVILNERQNLKSSKYSASSVPFPYENRAQYERSLLMPIGNEWSAKDTFQRQTKPRVIVKKGEIITPMLKPDAN